MTEFYVVWLCALLWSCFGMAWRIFSKYRESEANRACLLAWQCEQVIKDFQQKNEA